MELLNHEIFSQRAVREWKILAALREEKEQKKRDAIEKVKDVNQTSRRKI